MAEMPAARLATRRARLTAAACALAGAAAAAAQPAPPRTFDAEPAGTKPAGFAFAAMRRPSPGVWLVRRAGTNGYLAHESDPSAQGFGLAVAPDDPVRDAAVTIRLRLAGGSRAAGLVWRYQDADHHYQVLLDLSRRELAMYRVVGGNRIRVEDEEDLDLDADAWHTLKVAHDGQRIRVSLGGIRVFDDEDRTFRSGRVGLVAAAGAEVWFDDFRVETLTRNR
jgi:hypothetical protein